MKDIKFTHKYGSKTLSVTYYQDKRLRQLKGIKKKVFPIYLRIVFNRVTLKTRSILWKRLIEANNDFSVGAIFSDEKHSRQIAEVSIDIEKAILNDKDEYSRLCAYEFECIKRIITFALQASPDSTEQIVNAYSFWGQDGLREACENVINSVIKQQTSDEDALTVWSTSIRRYPPLSRNVVSFLKQGFQSNDPVSVIMMMEELGVGEALQKDKSLKNNFDHVVTMIGHLIFEFGRRDQQPTSALALAILYLPKIHFYYPLSSDFSPGLSDRAQHSHIKVADLQKMTSLISDR